MRRRGRLVIERDNLRCAPARLRHTFNQEPIHRVPDTEREYPRICVFLYFANNPEVVADIAVSQKTHHPQVVLRIRGIE